MLRDEYDYGFPTTMGENRLEETIDYAAKGRRTLEGKVSFFAAHVWRSICNFARTMDVCLYQYPP